jgi:hypothetical protein
VAVIGRATLREHILILRQRKKIELEFVDSSKEKDKAKLCRFPSPNRGEARTYVHIAALTFCDKMELPGELQWARAVVNLDGG